MMIIYIDKRRTQLTGNEERGGELIKTIIKQSLRLNNGMDTPLVTDKHVYANSLNITRYSELRW